MQKLLLSVMLSLPIAASAYAGPSAPSDATEHLQIGETFTLQSRVLDETRRINVYRPQAWGLPADAPLPVLYMPDGGIGEDFLHIAGLLQVSVGNGTMQPMLLVGIENTERRRDLTGPTDNPEDRKIAPRVGGSAAFRDFLRDELMPQIARRYAITEQRAIVGESLAGLFVVETLLTEPTLFDTYIAFDPSLWWNHARLLDDADERIAAVGTSPRRLYLASSSEVEIAKLSKQLTAILHQHAPAGLRSDYQPMPEEQHSTIYHPAALQAFRTVFAPTPIAAASSP